VPIRKLLREISGPIGPPAHRSRSVLTAFETTTIREKAKIFGNWLNINGDFYDIKCAGF